MSGVIRLPASALILISMGILWVIIMLSFQVWLTFYDKGPDSSGLFFNYVLPLLTVGSSVGEIWFVHEVLGYKTFILCSEGIEYRGREYKWNEINMTFKEFEDGEQVLHIRTKATRKVILGIGSHNAKDYKSVQEAIIRRYESAQGAAVSGVKEMNRQTPQ